MAIKVKEKRGVRRKSEIDDLFSRLADVYSRRSMYGVPCLPFPLLFIAQAKVWRPLKVPNPQPLLAEIERCVERGIDRTEIWLLIGICESLFRVVREYELSVENLFPEFLESRLGRDTDVIEKLLKIDFHRLWMERKREMPGRWVLAANSVVLPLAHRPGLVAPFVVGATLRRWITDVAKQQEGEGTEKRQEAEEGQDPEDVAVKMTAALMGRQVRHEEFRHWDKFLREVRVKTGQEEERLPRFLIYPGRLIRPPAIPFERLTPAKLLQEVKLPVESSHVLADHLKRAWRSTMKEPKAVKAVEHPKSKEQKVKAKSQAKAAKFYLCRKCGQELPMNDILDHLQDEHEFDKENLIPSSGGKHIRLKVTGELVATMLGTP